MRTRTVDPHSYSALVEEIRAARLPDPENRRRIRDRAGVSLREMARLLGVAPMTVLRWEHGQAKPRRANAASYRELLDVLEDAAR